MKNKEKKVKLTEEVKEEVQTEEEGTKLTDEELSKVSGGNVDGLMDPSQFIK